jgi:hypothetical protein
MTLNVQQLFVMTSMLCLLALIILPVTLFSQNNLKLDAFKKFSHLLLLPSDNTPQHDKIAGHIGTLALRLFWFWLLRCQFSKRDPDLYSRPGGSDGW